MLEVLQSVRVGEPAARQVRDEVEAVWRFQLRQHMDAAYMLADLLGEDASELFHRKAAKRQTKATT